MKYCQKEDINIIVEALERGQVLVLPTDTVYGLSCLANNSKAIRKIYRIKKRARNKPFLVLVKSFCMLKKYFFISARQNKFLHTIWNNNKTPITIISKSRKLLAPEMAFANANSARLPNDDFLIKIIKLVGVPLVSTSLNISGQPEITEIDNLEKYFIDAKPDLIVGGGKSKKKSSKIIDINDIDNLKIIRK
jgi:L-threonylcarbamoyladenylate synthase